MALIEDLIKILSYQAAHQPKSPLVVSSVYLLQKLTLHQN